MGKKVLLVIVILLPIPVLLYIGGPGALAPMAGGLFWFLISERSRRREEKSKAEKLAEVDRYMAAKRAAFERQFGPMSPEGESVEARPTSHPGSGSASP